MAPYRRFRWMKEIRIPCVPNSQSMASAQGSKLLSSVREHERCGSWDSGIGENRVSLKALCLVLAILLKDDSRLLSPGKRNRNLRDQRILL